MIFQFHQNGFSYEFDSTLPLDISLPIKDGRNNPNCYYADPVSFETIRAEEFIGDISKGGSVNHKKLYLLRMAMVPTQNVMGIFLQIKKLL
jgi:hypothetical protein